MTTSDVGFRPPAPGGTDDTTKANGEVDEEEQKKAEDTTGQFHLAVEKLEKTYDTCRIENEAALRRVARR